MSDPFFCFHCHTWFGEIEDLDKHDCPKKPAVSSFVDELRALAKSKWQDDHRGPRTVESKARSALRRAADEIERLEKLAAAYEATGPWRP